MKKHTIHFLLFSVFAFSIAITAHAESIYFSFTDGTQAAYNLTTVRNITFTGDVMNLTKTDGTIFSWNVSSIRNYRYAATIGIDEESPLKELVIYPNPAHSEVNLSFELANADMVTVTIFDSQGRLVYSMPAENKSAGKHQLQWRAKDSAGKGLPSGNYNCMITTSKGSMSKHIVIQ